MAERIDIRIYVRSDGAVRAYAERKDAPDISGPPTDTGWPAEFDVADKFRTYPALGDILFDVLLEIAVAREAVAEEAARAAADETPQN